MMVKKKNLKMEADRYNKIDEELKNMKIMIKNNIFN